MVLVLVIRLQLLEFCKASSMYTLSHMSIKIYIMTMADSYSGQESTIVMISTYQVTQNIYYNIIYSRLAILCIFTAIACLQMMPSLPTATAKKTIESRLASWQCLAASDFRRRGSTYSLNSSACALVTPLIVQC